jgi:dolichol-phosphate mannosyltransferase
MGPGSDRARDAANIDMVQMVAFAKRLMVLAGGSVSTGGARRFATVGAVSLVIDFSTFTALLAGGVSLAVAHVSSFIVAIIFDYVLNARWSFAELPESDWRHYARFLTVCVLALFLRGGVLATGVNDWGWPPQAAILPAIAASAIVYYLGNTFFVFPASSRVASDVRWRMLALALSAYAIALRLAYMGPLNLLPEEAYYWNYAQHLDIGYLDHPPMVAWLVWLGTRVAGDTEFGVRIGAALSWLAAAFFCFHLTRNLYGKTAAFIAVLLFSTLPFFFATGLLMTPDAPLTAAWAGTLYYLERALIAERRVAWLGVGICMGLGMLSKYTIALLAPATLVFILLDPGLRRWLWQPWPYLAAIVGLLIFSPVVIWNSLNDWASFAFQGTRRLEGPRQFSLPFLIGSILVLLTPVGFIAAMRTVFSHRFWGSRPIDRKSAFIVVYTLIPLLVFASFSLFHEVKLNWTGPLWLAVLPGVARNLATADGGRWIGVKPRRIWLATFAITLFIYGAALQWMVLGFPRVGLGANFSLTAIPMGWKEFGTEVKNVKMNYEQTTGKEPLVVGMDRYFQSSQIAFYDPDKNGVGGTAGRSLFGLDSVMFGNWFTPAKETGRDILVIGWRPNLVSDELLSSHFQNLGPVQERWVEKGGMRLARFYYRIGYNYRGNETKGSP